MVGHQLLFAVAHHLDLNCLLLLIQLAELAVLVPIIARACITVTAGVLFGTTLSSPNGVPSETSMPKSTPTAAVAAMCARTQAVWVTERPQLAAKRPL